eukprot:1620396-Ditylum_brightwellii.AAC.1
MFLMVLVETLKRRELHGSAWKMKLHGNSIVKGGQHQIRMHLKMGYRAATSSIKQGSKLSKQLHHTFYGRKSERDEQARY